MASPQIRCDEQLGRATAQETLAKIRSVEQIDRITRQKTLGEFFLYNNLKEPLGKSAM